MAAGCWASAGAEPKATDTAAARTAGTIRIDMESSRTSPFLLGAQAAMGAGVNRQLCLATAHNLGHVPGTVSCGVVEDLCASPIAAM